MVQYPALCYLRYIRFFSRSPHLFLILLVPQRASQPPAGGLLLLSSPTESALGSAEAAFVSRASGESRRDLQSHNACFSLCTWPGAALSTHTLPIKLQSVCGTALSVEETADPAPHLVEPWTGTAGKVWKSLGRAVGGASLAEGVGVRGHGGDLWRPLISVISVACLGVGWRGRGGRGRGPKLRSCVRGTAGSQSEAAGASQKAAQGSGTYWRTPRGDTMDTKDARQHGTCRPITPLITRTRISSAEL